MLNWIRVHNLAIVPEADVEFGRGFNAITGETGAGKSVIMGALKLLFGERADKSLIRIGENNCEIAAEFSLEDRKMNVLKERLEELSYISSDAPNILLIRRTITPTANRNFVNGSPSTLNFLRELSSYLVDVHAANENTKILDPHNQLKILDSFSNLKKESEDVKRNWNDLQKIQKDFQDFQATLPSAEEYNRLKRDEMEIKHAKILENEDVELDRRHALAANAHTILELSQSIDSLLSNGDGCISDQIVNCRRIIFALEKIEHDQSEKFLQMLDEIKENIDNLSFELNSFASNVEINENEFQEMEARIRVLQTLKRRYGPTLDHVIKHFDMIQKRIAAYEDAEIKREEYITLTQKQKKKWFDSASVLSEKRKAVAKNLETALSEETRKLGFFQAEFHLDFQQTDGDENGFDQVNILFSANPGMPLLPLQNIASSGEIARIMLAIKTVLAEADDIPTLVFDEIDANIGGETACRVGNELALLGKKKQIITISHLAQVASRANTHFKVEKSVDNQTTVSTINKLNDEERIDEIARMLGGGQSAKEHAKALLK